MAYTLKKDEAGNAVLKDGIPVWVDGEGIETALDVNSLTARVLSANAEATKRKEKIRELEAKLEVVKDVEDLATFVQEAERAKETVANLKEEDVKKAATVDKIKEEMRLGFSEKEKKLQVAFQEERAKVAAEAEALRANIRKLMVSSKFATNELFSGESPKTTLPPDVAESYFGKHFTVDDANGELKLTAKLGDDLIYSRERPGEPADFDEAIRVIFDKYPMKDRVLRATGSGGSNARGGQQGQQGTDTISALQKRLQDPATDPGDMIAISNKIFELQTGRPAMGSS